MEENDGIEAENVARRIVSAGDRGDQPSPDDLGSLADLIESQSAELAGKLRLARERGGELSVEDMFEMQMVMNQLTQLETMNSNVVKAANSAISSMVRNLKS